MGVHTTFLFITKTKQIYRYDKYTMWFLAAALSCFMLNSQYCTLYFMCMHSNLMGEKSPLSHSNCMAQVTAVSEWKFHMYFRGPHFVAVNQDIQNLISEICVCTCLSICLSVTSVYESLFYFRFSSPVKSWRTFHWNILVSWEIVTTCLNSAGLCHFARIWEILGKYMFIKCLHLFE